MILSTIYRHSSLSDLGNAVISYRGWRIRLSGVFSHRRQDVKESASVGETHCFLLIRFAMQPLAEMM